MFVGLGLMAGAACDPALSTGAESAPAASDPAAASGRTTSEALAPATVPVATQTQTQTPPAATVPVAAQTQTPPVATSGTVPPVPATPTESYSPLNRRYWEPTPEPAVIAEAGRGSPDTCLNEEGMHVPCEGPGGGVGGEEEPTTCFEMREGTSYFYQLGKCTPEHRKNGWRCGDHCLTGNGCQVYDDSINGTVPTSCPNPTRDPVSIAYKVRGELDFWEGKEYDHTYFCLTSNQQDCYTIRGYGFGSSKEGGEEIRGTRRNKDNHQRCLGEARASNFPISACGTFSQLYGLNGVCHQHTNRGQLSMHDTFIDPNLLVGGGLSFMLYGAYGNTWPVCYAGSEAFCGIAKVF
jgi:hypothetical protein